ncbi:hypothetical protein [Mariniflexile sp.]|uniref:hypothetical protein n=1 Tax=Mariniflexile sp. TaxID=1979402 RepID=UPI004047A88A
MELKTKTKKNFPLHEELLSLLKKELPLHSVYVISIFRKKKKQDIKISASDIKPQKSTTYTLLIIGHKPMSKGLGDFMDDLYNKMHQRCRVYVIYYTLANTIKKLDFGDSFLKRTIHEASCLYKETKALSRFMNSELFTHETVYTEIQKAWKTRMDRAGYLLSILDSIEPKEDTISRLSTMHHAMEQICLGLLYIYWEFKPHHYSLSYMLHLCSHFTNLPETMFPKKNYGQHRIHYMLCNAHHIMRFKTRNEFSDREAERAFDRCERFF